MFRDDYAGSPCKLFQEAKPNPASDSSVLPWLYYEEGDAQTVLSRKKITAKYSMDPSSKVSVDTNLTLDKQHYIFCSQETFLMSLSQDPIAKT
jgi:hypothetical protein